LQKFYYFISVQARIEKKDSILNWRVKFLAAETSDDFDWQNTAVSFGTPVVNPQLFLNPLTLCQIMYWGSAIYYTIYIRFTWQFWLCSNGRRVQPHSYIFHISNTGRKFNFQV